MDKKFVEALISLGMFAKDIFGIKKTSLTLQIPSSYRGRTYTVPVYPVNFNQRIIFWENNTEDGGLISDMMEDIKLHSFRYDDITIGFGYGPRSNTFVYRLPANMEAK